MDKTNLKIDSKALVEALFKLRNGNSRVSIEELMVTYAVASKSRTGERPMKSVYFC
jgi:hypothetical protein